MLSILGVVLSLILLVYSSMKGWSVFITSPICVIIVALTSGLNPVDLLLNDFMSGTASFMASWFILFMIGSVFGKIMECSGAASSLSRFLTKKIGPQNAVVAVIVATAIMTYGGISTFVIVFAVYPFALTLFQEADLPKRLIPGCIAVGAWGFTASSLPGSPQLQNVIPTQYFGTTATAAPVLGIICAIFIVVTSVLYMNRRAAQARKAGEHFVPSDKDIATMKNVDYENLPPLILSVLPIITLIILIIFVNVPPVLALAAATVLALILFFKRLKGGIKDTLNSGAANSMSATLNTSLMVGFASIVKITPAFSTIVAGLSSLSLGNPYVYECISVNLLAGITASASGGVSAALETLSETLLATGANPEILHRIASISANGLDSMPYCGAILTMFSVMGLSHKESYRDIFVTTVVINVLGSVLAVILGSLGVC